MRGLYQAQKNNNVNAIYDIHSMITYQYFYFWQEYVKLKNNHTISVELLFQNANWF